MTKSKFIFVFLLLLVIFLAIPFYSYADVAFPGWDRKSCKTGEVKYVCSYYSRIAFGPPIYEQANCKLISKSQDYYELTGRGSSFGGEVWYCLKIGKTPIKITQFSWSNFFRSSDFFGFIVIVAGVSFLFLRKIRKSGS